MNLLGIDVGTSGVKVALFTTEGELLASDHRAYDSHIPQPGWAELDAEGIWKKVKLALNSVVTTIPEIEITALCVSSLGEAVVPVSKDRQILAPSILNFDSRGKEFLPELKARLSDESLYAINGNTMGNHYTLTKLKWIQTYQPELYTRTYKFLHWSAFIGFMLGAEPAVDYSLANRTLLFDLHCENWSTELIDHYGLDREKLPETVPTGTIIGEVSNDIAKEIGLPSGVKIVSGAHDQCINAVGCGVINKGDAVFGMGTYYCITPVFSSQPDPQLMIARGLNTEHHAVRNRYVSFLYNQGGSLVKWYRTAFAAEEYIKAESLGQSIYPKLFNEMPSKPSGVMVLPHFTPTGPPEFIADSCGLIIGLHLETSRGEILKGIVEGAAFYLKELVNSLPGTGIQIENFRAVGGGSQSDACVQICADIFGKPFVRPKGIEAGALGAAITAGVGTGIFERYEEGVEAMVKDDVTFEPDLRNHQHYQNRFQKYHELGALMRDYLQNL